MPLVCRAKEEGEIEEANHEGCRVARQRDVRVKDVPDPRIQHPLDAIVRITSTHISGSDLHLYEVLGAFMNEGDILGHGCRGRWHTSRQ